MGTLGIRKCSRRDLVDPAAAAGKGVSADGRCQDRHIVAAGDGNVQRLGAEGAGIVGHLEVERVMNRRAFSQCVDGFQLVRRIRPMLCGWIEREQTVESLQSPISAIGIFRVGRCTATHTEVQAGAVNIRGGQVAGKSAGNQGQCANRIRSARVMQGCRRYRINKKALNISTKNRCIVYRGNNDGDRLFGCERNYRGDAGSGSGIDVTGGSAFSAVTAIVGTVGGAHAKGARRTVIILDRNETDTCRRSQRKPRCGCKTCPDRMPGRALAANIVLPYTFS